MFLAKTSHFASMRTESSSCRMLIIKRELNMNLYDGVGDDGLFRSGFVSDGERKCHATRQKREHDDHVGKKRRIAEADHKSVKASSIPLRCDWPAQYIMLVYCTYIRSHAITRRRVRAHRLESTFQPRRLGTMRALVDILVRLKIIGRSSVLRLNQADSVRNDSFTTRAMQVLIYC